MPPLRSLLLWAALLSGGAAFLHAQEQYDLLIVNGTIVDGSGSPGRRADIGVRDGRIVRIGLALLPASPKVLINAAGLVVAPGFIDLHAHLEGITRMPDAESEVRQGVTLALGGPDGGGPSPFAAYADRVAALPLGLNVAFLTGHNTIRRAVLGMADRAPTPAELARMQRLVAEAMGQGAFGLSTGLFYLPGTFSKTDEVVALARVAADSGGFYTSHLRNEGSGLLQGVAEAIEIGRRARIPVVLTHHKALGPRAWGLSVRTLAMMDSARAAGVDVMADEYPFTASSTGLGALVPAWAGAGGDSAFKRRVGDPRLRDSVLAGIKEILDTDRGGGDLKRVQFASVSWNHALEGRTLYDWVVERGMAPTTANAATLVVEGELQGGASMVYHVMDEEDVRRIMRHPMTAIASDGALSRPGAGVPHPRSYGTFPRVLGEYVRVQRVLTLEDAVRKMTFLPASRMGLTDRGRLVEGAVADITIFDPATVKDMGTYDRPHQYPAGIPWVIVNGVPVVADGQFTAARPGKVIRRAPGKTR